MIYEGLRANLWMLWSYLLRSLGSFLFVVDTVLKVTLLTLYFVDPKTLRVPNEGLRSYLWRPLTLSLKAIGLIAVWTWRSFEVTVLNLYFFDPKTFTLTYQGLQPYLWRPSALFMNLWRSSALSLFDLDTVFEVTVFLLIQKPSALFMKAFGLICKGHRPLFDVDTVMKVCG